MSFTAVRVDWTETERGWGTRPDGVTLHKDEDAAKAFIDLHWSRFPDGRAPDEYSYPDEPRKVKVCAHWHEVAQREGSFWVSHTTHIPDRDLLVEP